MGKKRDDFSLWMCYTGKNENATRASGGARGSFCVCGYWHRICRWVGLGHIRVREVVTVAVDWLIIRNDYINGLGNYRELSEKYGVSQSTIRKRAAAEKWSEAKEEQRNKIGTKLEQETAKAITEQEVGRVKRLLSISDKMIDKIEQAVGELDLAQVTNKTKTKVIEYKNGKRPDKPTREVIEEKEEILSVSSIIDRKGLQQIAVALKAMWDITGEHEANKEDEVEDDGLLAALGSNAKAVFDDGDDSGMLPKEKDA